MKTHIATVCDRNYLIRALTLYGSVNRNMPEARFWFLCMDRESKDIIYKLNLTNITAMSIEEIDDPELMTAKHTRSLGEFAMSSKASWLLYILKSEAREGDSLIYIDADILLFSSLEPLVNKMRGDNKSIAISPHRFPKGKESTAQKVGNYNSGFIAFIVSNESRMILEGWRKDCISWCYLRYDDPDRLGDQKYLDKWPSKSKEVYIIEEKGINTGSWNLSNWTVIKHNSTFFVDDDPIICYHFHRIQFYIHRGNVMPLPIYIFNKELYEIYVKHLERAWKTVIAIDPDWKHGFVGHPSMLRLIKQRIMRFMRNLKQRYA